MPGTYTVKHSDPSKPAIVIPPLTQNFSTPLTFVGYRSPVYGEVIWTNFLNLLENFSNPTAPPSAVQGQLWFNNAANATQPQGLYINDQATSGGVNWRKLSTTDESGAVGGGTDKVFWENDRVVTTDYTITAGKNAMSVGPISVNTGITVTVPTGSVWKVL